MRVSEVEVSDPLPPNYEFCGRGILVATKREQTLELNAGVRTVAPKEVDENQDTCVVSSNN